jgi:hypothetical protein
LNRPSEVNEPAGEPAYGGESSSTLCGQIREPSARQLPTNRDHEGGASRSSNISMINRRNPPTSSADSFTSGSQKKKRATKDQNVS